MRISLSFLCLVSAALFSIGCDDRKKPEPSSPSAEAPEAKPSLAAEAKSLGMAGLVPQDTAFYFGSADLKKHREALQTTRLWKDLEAFINDKTPAGSARKGAKTQPLTALNVNEFFIAIGKQAAASLAWAKELNAVYSEYTYLMMMTGYTSGGAKGKAAGLDIDAILSAAASHPELLDRLCSALVKVEIPPLTIGIKTDKPDELVRAIIDPAAPPSWLAQAKKTTATGPHGLALTTYEGTIGTWLTEQRLQEWMTNVTKAVADPAAQAQIKTTLTTLAAKKVALTIGTNADTALMAVGTDSRQLEFASTPEQSLLARQDFAFARTHAGKNFVGLLFAEGQLIDAVRDEQPFTPMLRGALNGLAANPVLGKLALSLRPKVEELAHAERKVHAFTASNAAGLLWWDQGLHLDMAGGYIPQGDALTKPRKFTGLIDTPTALLVADGHSASTGAGRLYFEKWMDLLYTASGELVKAGLGGEQAGAMYPLVDKIVVPALRQMYDASKTVYQQALGTESALVIDVGGEMPVFPGMAPSGTKLPMLRVASVHEVTDRVLISKSWERMDLALQQGLQSSPIPMALPAPISSKDNGLVTWFYPLPFGGNDLLPCVSLNDQVYVLGSSKSLNEALAAQLQKPAPTGAPTTGTLYRIRFKTLRTLVKSASSASIPGMKADATGGDSVLPWLAPFEDLNARVWQEGAQLRISADWEMRDVVKYD